MTFARSCNTYKAIFCFYSLYEREQEDKVNNPVSAEPLLPPQSWIFSEYRSLCKYNGEWREGVAALYAFVIFAELQDGLVRLERLQ